jgi:hypothetical protein
MTNIIALPVKDDITKHDDCSQRIRAQEAQLQQAHVVINELRAAVGYWKSLADGFGR